MKNKSLRLITFILAFIMLFTSSTELLAMSFKDTNDSWAKDYISWCADNGIISGYTDGSFKPNNKITRAEFATMLAKSIKKEASSIVDINYEDVKPKDWYYAPVRKLVSFGILDNKGKFYPNKLITRELAIKWLASTIDYKTKLSLINNYSDEKDIVNKEAFEKLLELNILSGYPNKTLRPKNLITRAEAAKLFYTYMSIVNEKGILLDILKNDIDTDKSDKNEDKDKKSDADNKINYPEIPYRPHRPTDDWDDNQDDAKPSTPKKRFNLNINSTDDYTVEITPASIDGKYEEGQVINVKISLKNDKKQIKQVLINGNNIASVNGTYSFIMPSEESSLDVVLENKPIEQKDDLTIDFEDEDEEVKIKRNTKLKFKADTKDPEAKEINLRLNRESDTHLIYLNTYPIDSKTSSINDIDFVVPDYLEPGRYILSVKSGKPESKIQTKIIIVEDNFEKVESIEALGDIIVTQGDDIVLPQYVNAKFSDGSTRSLKINWNLPDSFENAGEYNIVGHVDSYNKDIQIKVIVNKKRAKLESILPIKDMTIVKGASINLPKFIKVKMDDGSKEERTAYWNEINFTSDKIGNYSIDGYILTDEADLSSKKLPIKINIIVKDSEPFEAHIALFKDRKYYYPFQKDAMLGSKNASGNAPIEGDYALLISLKDANSKIDAVKIYPEDPSLNMTVRTYGSISFIDKSAFFMSQLKPIKTKIIADITIDGEQYTKTIDFVAGNGFKKEAVAIKEDLNFTYPQGKLNLQDSVVALYNDGTEGKSSITWDLTNVDKNIIGTYDITGTLASGLVVKAKLNIIEYKDINLTFNQAGTVTIKQNEYIMPNKELTLSVDGVMADEVKSIEILSDNDKVVKIESYDNKFDGSNIKIKAKAVGIGNATITCKLVTTNGQEATQKLNVIVNPIREFKADEFAVIAKDGGQEYGLNKTKIRIVSKYEDIELYGKVNNILYNTVKINTSEEADAYKKYSSLIGTKVSLSVYLERYGSTPQAKLDGVKVIKEGDPFPWQESEVKFKAEDFSLSFDDQGWGGMLMLNCTNADANKIKTFALYDSTGKSLFYDPEFVPFDEGGFISTVPADGTEYTLKVFADEDGNLLLYVGKIIYGTEETIDGFKAEDFSLSFDDQGWGGMLMLNCTNADANKIKTFALYDSSGNSLFYDPEFVPFDEGGFISTVPADGIEYTLKVFADEKGQDLLYEGPIKFTK
ncbi:S-layer homology domain-containing protein [Fenollaria timonensis]|uniref:S-layer homology domain-containing protein n=1 Tax=Fenollaria timonensis TaxID=1723384 RepID=UPI00071D3B62|nr:S-layer homology domain-containing protein [Fenollaria timonensis]